MMRRGLSLLIGDTASRALYPAPPSFERSTQSRSACLIAAIAILKKRAADCIQWIEIMKMLLLSRIALGALAALLFAIQVNAQSTNQAIKLWADAAPGALGNDAIDVPTITPYLPPRDKATGAAVVVCPGGGYEMLADHEGK